MVHLGLEVVLMGATPSAICKTKVGSPMDCVAAMICAQVRRHGLSAGGVHARTQVSQRGGARGAAARGDERGSLQLFSRLT